MNSQPPHKKLKTSNAAIDIDDIVPQASINISKEFRMRAFQSGYKLLKNQFTLMDAQELNQVVINLTPVTLAHHMDHLSYKLINTDLTTEIELTLKLSLCRILNLIGGPTRKIQEEYFINNGLQEKLYQIMSQKPTLIPGLSDEMSKMYDEIMLIAENGKVELKIFIAKKKTEVLAAVGDESELYGFLEIMANIPVVNGPKSSELTYYRRYLF